MRARPPKPDSTADHSNSKALFSPDACPPNAQAVDDGPPCLGAAGSSDLSSFGLGGLSHCDLNMDPNSGAIGTPENRQGQRESGQDDEPSERARLKLASKRIGEEAISVVSALSTSPIDATKSTDAQEQNAPEESPAVKSPSKDDKHIPVPVQIVKIVNDFGWELFHDKNKVAFVTLKAADHLETYRLRDSAFKSRLRYLYHLSAGGVPSAENLGAALGVLEGQALYDGKEKVVNLRVAQTENSVYLDLGNDNWEAIEITPSGWRVMAHSPLVFWRPEGMRALAKPASGGSMDELRPFLHVRSDDDFLLACEWLVACLRPVGPFPILNIEGNHGTAKSTTTRFLRSLVDPNSTPLRSLPREERDLMIAAKNSWCQAFENVSDVPDWLSDAFCRLSTGGGLSKRRHYADDEEILFDACRPIMLNGIHIGLNRPDAVDRSILITLAEISAYKQEAELWAEFEKVKPRIFGALVSAVSCALKRLPETKVETPPRMADFAYWATAAEPALGSRHGSFLRAYRQNRKEANERALDNSVIAPVIGKLIQDRDFKGTATDLLREMETQAKIDGRQKGWPNTAGALSGLIRRLTPSFASAGITIEIAQTSGSNSKKIISIKKDRSGASPTTSTIGIDSPSASTASLASLFEPDPLSDD